MSYKSIANPAISVDEAQELDRSNAQTFNSAHHNGKVGLGSKLLATLPTETQKTGLVYLPTEAEKASFANIPSAAEKARIPSADGQFTHQTLEWDGDNNNFAPWGFKDTFDTDGDETSLDSRWTLDNPLDGGAGEAITISSNALTVQTASAGSLIRIFGPDFDSLPFDLRMHLTFSGFASNNDRFDLEVGGNYTDAIVLRVMRFSGATNIYSAKSNTAFDTEGGVSSPLWLRIVGMEDGTVHTFFSTNGHDSEPSGLTGWTLLGSSTLAGIAGSTLSFYLSGSAQVTATVRNFKLSRPH